jgi:S1-C subfamily serine protease
MNFTHKISIAARLAILPASLLVICAPATSVMAGPRQQNSQQAQARASQFRVIRIVCGSKGVSRGAEFEMQDTRTVFRVPEDHQIIVYFEWEGPPGTHHAVGTWRSPDGKAALTSDFDLTSAGTRYTGTWRLAIPESIAIGLWALEAQIDDQPAGTQTFEIARSETAAPAPPPMPSAAQIYQWAAAASVVVTSLDQDGEVISSGLGSFVDKGIVLTAFQLVDGASSVRVDLADGSRATVANLVAWNRRQDWAILKMDSRSVEPLQRAKPNSWKVGDVCYVLASQGQGSRTIQTVNITGLQGTGPSQRLTISVGGTIGAPLLDGYGHLIGILGGDLSGLGSRRMGTWALYMDAEGVAATFNQLTALPLASIPDEVTSQRPTTFADLAAQAVLIPPLVRNSQAANGTLCEDFQRLRGVAIEPVRPNRNFSRQSSVVALVVVWAPTEKVKGTQQLRIYDEDNHAVAQTPPSKLELQPRVTMFSAWKVSLGSLPPGIYRIDLLVDDQPQWREFFRING